MDESVREPVEKIELSPTVAGRAEPTTVRPLTPEARHRRDLNQVVHSALVIGLIASTGLMIIGVILDLVKHRVPPSMTIPVGESVERAMGLRPSGFLELGLLVLILTPLLRVVGSVIVFLHERDWRYAGITALVLLIMLVSIISGYAG
jgi:uncharacterized membrane protein